MNRTFYSIEKLRVLTLAACRHDTQSLISFSTRYLWIFFLCFVYGFFYKSALWQKTISFSGHSIDFPLFLLSGLMMARIIPFSIRIFEDVLSQLKNSGLIEWVLVTPSSLWELFASKALWNLFVCGTELIALVGFSKLCIGIPIRPFFQWTILPPIFYMFIAYMGIGMIISGLSLLLKKGGSFLIAAFLQTSGVFGGVFFPTELFTGKLKLLLLISHCLPITIALKTMRLILISKSATNSVVHTQLLSVIAFILLFTGIVFLQAMLVWAKKNGEFSKKLYN